MNTTSASKEGKADRESKALKRRLLFSDAGHFFAFGMGAGLTPRAPGTAGTLLAAPLYYAAAAVFPPPLVWFIAFLLLAAGVPLCARAAAALQSHDDGAIVWDELAAFFALLAFVPDDWRWQLAAFFGFRLLDALKPFPLSWLDKNLRGGWGIMADDIAAAAAVAAALAALTALT